MWKPLVAVVLYVPVVANAGPLFLKYEGTVSAIEENCPCPSSYSIGDPVSGVLTIDTSLTLPDLDERSSQGFYYRPIERNGDFVSGTSRPPNPVGGEVFDRVFITNNEFSQPDGQGPRQDRFVIFDAFDYPYGPGKGEEAFRGGDNLVLSVNRTAPYGQLFQDDGLVQSFDVTPDEGTTFIAYIAREVRGSAGAFKQLVSFDLTHMSLGTCRP